ncbi:predicted protein [Histoplasma mississippiense (nom. inval.)]|uniref:predicted protein n=1 Tax=Ajellomyces capsulatus (strain NAm1 / WU24) TaxID=2059318 RepID=UPI000157C7BD|nr:predicted protein [Histoplasma mississippiense (nom. inval.)]EDN08184.1 predicted protein [Histoplasma mississippiense (nom. inval.)]
MASAESEPHDIIVIDDDTDAETVALHSPSQELWRKRRHTDYSFSEYEALFDDPTLPDASAPTAAAANQEIHAVFEVESTEIKALKAEVRHLKQRNIELEAKQRAELSRKKEQIRTLKAEVNDVSINHCFHGSIRLGKIHVPLGTFTCQAHMAKLNPAARFYVRHPHKKIPLVGPPGSRGDLKRISYFTKSLKNHQELTQRKCLEIS